MNIHFHRATPGGIADEAALEQFQKQWATYLKLVDADALSHKEVGAIHLPFAFLDIACGDAGQMKHALASTEVNHYHRIDLSEPALELAAKNLKCVPFAVELDHRERLWRDGPSPPMRRGAGFPSTTSPRRRKLELLAAIHGSTSKMLIYEPTLADGEDREGYLARFRRVNRPAWPFLTKDEWDQIDHHVTTCDFPESPATSLDIGRKASFSAANQVFSDPTGFYSV